MPSVLKEEGHPVAHLQTLLAMIKGSIGSGQFLEIYIKIQQGEEVRHADVIGNGSFAADKTSIYPEFLPNYIKVSNKNHRIDKFIKILRKKSADFPLLDLRPILLEAKKNEIIYHETDTHWNARGAHYGYV